MAIFRLIDGVSSIENTGDKTGKIDVFAAKKTPGRVARPLRLRRR
jgi:hypothetical protein